MKITRVETVVANAEMRNWIFVKVETDNDGLFGWGEASLEWKARSVVGGCGRSRSHDCGREFRCRSSTSITAQGRGTHG